MAGRGVTPPQGCATRWGPQGAPGQPDHGRGRRPRSRVLGLCGFPLSPLAHGQPGQLPAHPGPSTPWLSSVPSGKQDWTGDATPLGLGGWGAPPAGLDAPRPSMPAHPSPSQLFQQLQADVASPALAPLVFWGNGRSRRGCLAGGGSASPLHQPPSRGSWLPRLPSCLAHPWPPPPFSVRDFAVEAPRPPACVSHRECFHFYSRSKRGPQGSCCRPRQRLGEPRAALPASALIAVTQGTGSSLGGHRVTDGRGGRMGRGDTGQGSACRTGIWWVPDGWAGSWAGPLAPHGPGQARPLHPVLGLQPPCHCHSQTLSCCQMLPAASGRISGWGDTGRPSSPSNLDWGWSPRTQEGWKQSSSRFPRQVMTRLRKWRATQPNPPQSCVPWARRVLLGSSGGYPGHC